jgi:dienelactone hydrolase
MMSEVKNMVSGEAIEYLDGEASMEGYVACDTSGKSKRPGVLVIHDWMGVGSYTKRRADQLADLGYVALAADIYGKGVHPETGEEAAKLAGRFKSDYAMLRRRCVAGLEALKNHPFTDVTRMAAIGYCFGGTAVLELARSGAQMAGFVSFHGGLATPVPQDAANIRGKVLVLHGADDPFVPAPEMLAFIEEMRKGKVDWQMVIYGSAVHSFTNRESGDDPSKGAAYDEKADRRSWEAMKGFFQEIFG